MDDRLTHAQNTAIVAHFSYELEPRTPLPDWNAVAMETVHLRNENAALSAALTKLQQGQPYRYIGKDMKTILARDLEDQRDAALAALTQSRAETAAAEARGMRKAAEIVSEQAIETDSTDAAFQLGDASRAILAAIPQGDTTND